MLKNYLKIALRHLQKHKGYSFINIAGLTIGMAACVLIMLYVQDELSYDRYHENADQIYRVNLNGAIGGSFIHTATSSAPMGATLVQEYPEVLNAVRFLDTRRPLIAYEDHQFYEDNVLLADSTVFDLFTFPLVEGDPKTALAEPNTLVLTEAMAKKYFGDDDPVGQTLRLNDETDYTVTGVLKSLPATSHFPIDFLLSMASLSRSVSDNWVSNSFYTYILLPDGANPADVEAKFPALIKKYVAPQIEQALGQSYEEALAAGLEWAYELQPLTRIYLHSDGLEGDLAPMSDAGAVYILSAIAVLILLIACINFMNLATARSANRAREVGLRKVMGSLRKQLVGQFLGESVLLALIGGLLAFVAIQVVLPFFNDLAGKTLSLAGGARLEVLGGLMVIALASGLLAGIYPALVLSSFQPVAVLKGVLGAGAKSSKMRSVLVVLQFAASIVLLVGTGVVFTQLDFMLHKNLGFTQEQVVVLPIETDAGRQGFEAFRNELLAQPNVVQVAAAQDLPGRMGSSAINRGRCQNGVHGGS
ncbi:MAG: ABC transporter permease [Rhodothermales bacterium]